MPEAASTFGWGFLVCLVFFEEGGRRLARKGERKGKNEKKKEKKKEGGGVGDHRRIIPFHARLISSERAWRFALRAGIKDLWLFPASRMRNPLER